MILNKQPKQKTAIALEYNPDEAAPKVIATGKGLIAEKIIEKAKEENIPYVLVVTKTDKINQSEKAKLLKSLKDEGIEVEKVFQTSALDRKGTDKLKKEIEKSI